MREWDGNVGVVKGETKKDGRRRHAVSVWGLCVGKRSVVVR